MTHIEILRETREVIAKANTQHKWAAEEQAAFIAVGVARIIMDEEGTEIEQSTIDAISAAFRAKKEGFSNTSQNLQIVSKALGWTTKAQAQGIATANIMAQFNKSNDENEGQDS